MSDAEKCKEIANNFIKDTVDKFEAIVLKQAKEAAAIGKFSIDVTLYEEYVNSGLIVEAIFARLQSEVCGFKVEYVDVNKSMIRIYWL
jgi:hypothetical protein